MLITEKQLRHYKVRATDGDVGSIDDLYFDDKDWQVRYLIIETGGWLGGRRVLIDPHAAAGTPDLEDQILPFNLTQEKIRQSPPTAFDKPVDEQHQTELYAYYGWPYYWGAGFTGGAPFPFAPVMLPPEPERDEKKGDPHLRSANEVRGYHLLAHDGELGHVEDFVLDAADWRIRYLVVDTRNWLPGKRVLVAPQWIEDIDWYQSQVKVGLEQEAIRQCPEYDPERLPTREYEEQLHRHYGREGYWNLRL